MAIPVRKSRKSGQQWTARGPAGHGPSSQGVRERGEGEEVVSEAQRQLQQLLSRQLDTSARTLQRTVQTAGSMFTNPTTFQPETDGVAPLRSIGLYRSDQEVLGRRNELRGAGLSECEVALVEGDGVMMGGVGVEPSAMEARRKTIQEKLSEHTASLEAAESSSGVRGMGRHAWEVEQSLYHTAGGRPLQHLTTLSRDRSARSMAVYPAHLLPGNQATQPAQKEECLWEEDERGAGQGGGVTVPALPLQLLQRNRLSSKQIQQLPRFSHYSPGPPSSVLYIKNIHRRASLEDLQAIFGYWQEGVWPKVRLLTGRMRGQAFAHFPSVSAASAALAEVHGYLVQDKPLIVSYSNTQATPTPSPAPHEHND